MLTCGLRVSTLPPHPEIRVQAPRMGQVGEKQTAVAIAPLQSEWCKEAGLGGVAPCDSTVPTGLLEHWHPTSHSTFFIFNTSRVRAEIGHEALLHRAELRMLRQGSGAENPGAEQRLELYQVRTGTHGDRGCCGGRHGDPRDVVMRDAGCHGHGGHRVWEPSGCWGGGGLQQEEARGWQAQRGRGSFGDPMDVLWECDFGDPPGHSSWTW